MWRVRANVERTVKGVYTISATAERTEIADDQIDQAIEEGVQKLKQLFERLEVEYPPPRE